MKINLDWLATRGGQLLGCYILSGLILWEGGTPSKDTADKLLFLVIGAVLRDMQDDKSTLAATPPKEDK